jgi:hypothetical protein
VSRVLICAVVLPAVARAHVPQTTTYQGQVLGPGGVPTAGPVDIEIGIWDSVAGGARLYREQHLDVPLSNGVYDVVLGTGSNKLGTFGAATFAGPDRWLELILAGETLAPRQPFAAVPYAFRAEEADAVDGIDGAALMPRAGGSFSGAVFVNGPNGQGNVFLGGGTDPNAGVVRVLNGGGQARGLMGIGAGGDGLVGVLGAAGGVGALMTSAGNSGLVSVLNSDGDVAAVLGTASKAGSLQVLGPNGQPNVIMGPSGNVPPNTDPDRGSVTLHDQNGILKVLIIVDAAGQGVVDVVSNRQLPAVGMRVLEAGDGIVFLEGPQGEIGNLNVVLGGVNGAPNRGSISVHDVNSVGQAGLFVNSAGQGQMFADVKNFVVEHPLEPDKRIVYASLEGPEVAIFHRGVVRLVGGRASIALPEHFSILAVPGSITAQLTPASLDSQGVGIAAITDDRVDIGELHGGTGTYDVHFVVHAVRRGYEAHQPVMSADAFAASLVHGVAPDPIDILPPPIIPGRHGGSQRDAGLGAAARAAASAVASGNP